MNFGSTMDCGKNSTLASNGPPPSRPRCAAALGLAAGLYLLPLSQGRSEDHIDYRHEFYKEDAGRINVDTDSVLFEKVLTPWLSAKGEVVYDAISGASPTGAPPPTQITFVPPALGGPTGPFKDTVPLAHLADIRWAGVFEPTFSYGPHRLTPQFAYSEEHDYVSYGAALNYAIDLNQKNTTLNVGWSHNWDKVLPKGFLRIHEHKDSDDFLIGVNQLLGPRTVFTANFTYGNSHGYLNDQYKGVYFVNDVPQLSPDDPALEAEKRPRHRDRYIGYVSLTQGIAPLKASVEGSYRFFHDTFGVDAHTVDLAWFQTLGKHLIVSPNFRYYRQTAATFYAPSFPDFNNPPPYYSADYRLSELESFTGGVIVHVKVTKWLGLDGGYKRYAMRGLDSVTSQSAYPAANIFTLGARLWF